MRSAARAGLLVAAAMLAGAVDPSPPAVSPPAASPPAESPPAAPPPGVPPVPTDTPHRELPLPPPAHTEKIPAERANGIIDAVVHGPDSAEIGHLIDVLVDAGGKPRAAMIDFGGFMGVGSRKVAVSWTDLRFKPAAPDGMTITLDLSADQIKAVLIGKNEKPAAVVVTKDAAPAAPAAEPGTAAAGASPAASSPASQPAQH